VTFLAYIVMLSAFFVTGGAPLHGWTGYPPLSALPSAGPGEALGADLWVISIALFCIGALMSALTFITTDAGYSCARHVADAHAAHLLGLVHHSDFGTISIWRSSLRQAFCFCWIATQALAFLSLSNGEWATCWP